MSTPTPSGTFKLLYQNSEYQQYIKISGDTVCRQTVSVKNKESGLCGTEKMPVFSVCSECHITFGCSKIPESHLKWHERAKIKERNLEMFKRRTRNGSVNRLYGGEHMGGIAYKKRRDNHNDTQQDLYMGLDSSPLSSSEWDSMGLLKESGWMNMYFCIKYDCDFKAGLKSKVLEHITDCHSLEEAIQYKEHLIHNNNVETPSPPGDITMYHKDSGCYKNPHPSLGTEEQSLVFANFNIYPYPPTSTPYYCQSYSSPCKNSTPNNDIQPSGIT